MQCLSQSEISVIPSKFHVLLRNFEICFYDALFTIAAVGFFVDWTACYNVSSLGSDRSDTGDGCVWASSTSVVSGRGSVGVSVWLWSLPASQHHCLVFTDWQGRHTTSDVGQVSDWWKGSYHHQTQPNNEMIKYTCRPTQWLVTVFIGHSN